MRLLVVDDEDFYREAVRLGLADRGFEIRAAGDPDEASRLAAEWSPHAALIDWNLQHALNGIDVAVHLRRSIPEIGLILMTGSELSALKRSTAVRPTGPCVFLSKPFVVEDLLAAIRRAIAAEEDSRSAAS